MVVMVMVAMETVTMKTVAMVMVALETVDMQTIQVYGGRTPM